MLYFELISVSGANADQAQRRFFVKRPYIICHMTVSVDGAVTGDFLANPLAAPATEVYYEINRE